MILDDGYTETVGIYRVRRFLTSDRKRFDELLRAEQFTAAKHLLLDHISDSEGRRIPAELVDEAVAEIAVANPTERADLRNLQSGMCLMLEHPRLAIRPCELCKQWWFDEDTGLITNIGNQNVRRPAHAPTACQTDRGCRKGTPENPTSFNARNQKAFEHWMQWRFVGCPDPNDSIIRRNWMWFESLKENHGLRKLRHKLP